MPRDSEIDATLVASEADLVDVRHCRLEVLDGPAAGAVLDPLPLRTLIGRQPWCDLVLLDPRVSGTHAEILIRGNTLRVRDRGSTNGIWAGSIRLFDAHIEPGTLLRVGGSRLRIDALGQRLAARSPDSDASGRLVGRSPAMQELFDMLGRVAARDLPVLLLGETGTGKTAVAEALHHQSPRREGPFVAINCGGLPPELVESTLFGHVKGAFTGAHKDTPGVFQQARGGTLFLDEIGELPLALQPKLLTALDAGRVRPVGGEREVATDFRLITATNREIWGEVEAGRFRQDLYFRVAGIELVVPPLRERREDLPLLAQRLLERLAQDDPALARAPSLSEGALARLAAHAWPGNVRELANVLARASMLAGESDLDAEHIRARGWSPPSDDAPAGAPAADTSLDLDSDFKTFKARLLARHERAFFARLMERVGDNITQGAREAGISRTYLLTMLRRYGLYEDLGA
ncbi:MAG: sigma 54-interacting transcriptional regulator [Pseudomonadota bacterium]